MITIAICEDENVYINTIKEIIKDKFDFSISDFTSGEELLEAFSANNSLADIYIMDIELPGIGGFDAACIIKQINSNAIIIFITNYDNYVFKAYEIEAFRYIPKSDMKDKLPKALESAIKKIEKNKNELERYIVIGSQKRGLVKKVCINDIVSFEKILRHIEFRLISGETLSDNRSIKSVLAEINDDRFVLAKKGVVININYIVGFNGEMAILSDNTEQHISRDNLKAVKLRTLKNWR